MKEFALIMLLLVACAAKVESPYPPKPYMEPPVYEPTQDIPLDSTVFLIELASAGFAPALIEVKSREIKFLVTALDDDHDFVIDDLDIDERLPKLRETVIAFTPPPGIYEFYCEKNCGPGAVGTLVVR